jgi:hypothetical protein
MDKTKPRYIIEYWFDWRAGCFWSANDEMRERFGYAIDPQALPLSVATIKRVNALMDWHDQALNWDYPLDPGPWRQDECDRFNQAAKELLEMVRMELGEDFEIIDRFVEEKEDPDLDAYVRNSKGFKRRPLP